MTTADVRWSCPDPEKQLFRAPPTDALTASSSPAPLQPLISTSWPTYYLTFTDLLLPVTKLALYWPIYCL